MVGVLGIVNCGQKAVIEQDRRWVHHVSATRARSARAALERRWRSSNRFQNQNEPPTMRPADEAVDDPVLGQVDERGEHQDGEHEHEGLQPDSA